ncbi:MAG: PDDEXK nuclease domain-containing protein [Campylobacterota bacterium]|nr:PDDEXK nuclease domain-containing protein [Campylobacterota bacterium]
MNDLTTLQTLIDKINTIHTSVQQETLKSVSKNLVLRNWLIGYYIVEYEQNGEDRAKYGDRLIENISKNLSHIKGMSKSNLHSFKQFYLYYPQISQTVSGKFNLQNKKFQTVSGKSIEISIGKLLQVSTFSHFIEYMRLDSDLKRAFYEIETIKGNWSVRELKRQINSQTYERIGLSIDKKQMIDTIQNSSENLLPMQIIKDPYILEFTGLEEKIKYSENDLESSLLNHLQDFLLELGNGFCFEARQKRISIDNEHDRVDLVFYHRILKCHILIDLKIREFSHADVGQMNFYLNYYKNEIVDKDDNPPIGLILCANKNNTKVEYATAGLDNNLFVSKYKINLPSIEEIEEFLEDEMDGFDG